MTDYSQNTIKAFGTPIKFRVRGDRDMYLGLEYAGDVFFLADDEYIVVSEHKSINSKRFPKSVCEVWPMKS